METELLKKCGTALLCSFCFFAHVFFDKVPSYRFRSSLDLSHIVSLCICWVPYFPVVGLRTAYTEPNPSFCGIHMGHMEFRVKFLGMEKMIVIICELPNLHLLPFATSASALFGSDLFALSVGFHSTRCWAAPFPRCSPRLAPPFPPSRILSGIHFKTLLVASTHYPCT